MQEGPLPQANRIQTSYEANKGNPTIMVMTPGQWLASTDQRGFTRFLNVSTER